MVRLLRLIFWLRLRFDVLLIVVCMLSVLENIFVVIGMVWFFLVYDL